MFHLPSIPRPSGRRGNPTDRTFYNLLGVLCNASTREITKAFHHKSRKEHPDKGGDKNKFQRIVTAYEVLKDPCNRICYDGFGPDFKNIPGIEAYRQSLKSRPLIIEVAITLKELIDGVTKTVNFSRKNSGQIENITKQIEVPSGHSSETVIVEKQGHVELEKLPGDLTVKLKLVIPSNFRKVHQNLIFDCKLTWCHCLLGTPFEVNHPSGKLLIIEPISKPIQPGSWFTVKHQGVCFAGDLHVCVGLTNLPAITQVQAETLIRTFNIPQKILTTTHKLSSTTEEKVQQSVNHGAGQRVPRTQEGCPVQ